MTPTEAIYKRMTKRPKSTLLVGGRSEQEFVRSYFPGSQDILWIDSLIADEIARISHFSSLAPIGEYRVVCIKNICHARKDVQATLLKLIEESPDRTHWVFSVTSQNKILEPIVSRSFVLDWIQEATETLTFTEILQDLIRNKSYLDVFRLHEKILLDADKDLSQVKEQHIACLTELMSLLPASKSAKLHKARNELLQQNRTEVTFKSALMEVIS